MNRRPVVVLLSLAAAAIVAGALLARLLGGSVTLQSGTWLPQARSVAEFHLQDLSGRDFDRENLRGHPTLLFFGFSNCPDACPTTLATLAQLQRRPPVSGTQVVFVSIDPERDSAAVLQVYLGAFSKDFIGLRGDSAALAPLLGSLEAIAEREDLSGGDYTMHHSASLYLLDSRGRLAAVFSPPFSAAGLAADLAKLGSARRL
ncbi:MAG TPA: SCO family protein [Steroidobacteraceae bacterium]|nr:SCO family protein [Steroidobacteraceae bacterium]